MIAASPSSTSAIEVINLGAVSQHEFSALVEPHRSAIQAHCYRMLGSLHEAEELVQDTFFRAWQRRSTYASRAPLRSWLYRIATNLCLDALERRPRRALPVTHQAVSNPTDPIPADVNEPIWLEPFPDELLASEDYNPEARYSQRESIALAFITSLHQLPPRQRAVLILRDVLDWKASEVAQFLEVSVSAVKSTLHRARSTLGANPSPMEDLSPVVESDTLRDQLNRYVQAWETADVDGLTALLKEEATFSMPPIPSWYQGRANLGVLVGRTVFAGQPTRRWKLHPAHANGQTAFGLYRWDEAAGLFQGYGIQVLTLDGAQVADITTFRIPNLIPRFNLPTSLPA